MLPIDIQARMEKYSNLKQAMELSGYSGEILETSLGNDKIGLSVSADATRKGRLLVAEHDNVWFLMAPLTSGHFRIPVETNVETVCRVILQRLASVGEPVVIDEALQKKFQLEQIQGSDIRHIEEALRASLLCEHGWIVLTRSEDDIILDRYCELNHIESKSSFPGASEPPKPFKTWDISWLYSLEPQVFIESEICINRKIQYALRKCVPVGETVYASIWNSSAYSFNPHAEISKICADYWPVSVMPDDEWKFLFSADLSFGILSSYGRGSISIFGEKLLDAISLDMPKELSNLVAEEK